MLIQSTILFGQAGNRTSPPEQDWPLLSVLQSASCQILSDYLAGGGLGCSITDSVFITVSGLVTLVDESIGD